MTDRRPDRPHRRRIGHVEDELEAELQFHFESTVDELRSAGLTHEEALAEARRRFGPETRYRRELKRIDRDTRLRVRWRHGMLALDIAWKDALRTLVRSPGLALGVILAFALGIGANATMFGIVDRLLLTPPSHIREPDAVKRLVVDRYVSFVNDRVQSTSLAYRDYADFTRVPQFAAVAAFQPQRLTLGRGESAVRANGMMVTGSWWDLLGVRPVIGRFFTPGEDRIGGDPIAVVSYALWQQRFGGEPSVLGSTIEFGHGPYTIIGVTPRGFTGIDLDRVDVWLPLHAGAAVTMGEHWFDESRGGYWLRAIGRLAAGVAVTAAEEAVTAAHRAGRAASVRTSNYDAEARVIASPLIVARAALQAARDRRVGGMFFGRGASREASVALWLVGVALVVLLVACVNVANLFLARAIRQRRDTAIRVALGVSRSRLIGQTVADSILLAGLGGLAAVAVTRWGGDLVRSVLLPGVEFPDGGLGTRVLPFILGLSVVAGVLAAIVPAVDATRRNLADTLRTTSGGITRSTHRVRASLTIAQSALCVLLLVGAGLFLRSLHGIRSLDPGFDPDGLHVATFVVEGGSLSEEEKRSFFPAAVERLNAQPRVRDVAWSQSVPFRFSWIATLRIPGRDSLPSPRSGGPYIVGVSPDYLRTMDLGILRGRGFEAADFGNGLAVIVNESLATLYWPGEDPLGACLRIGDVEDDPPCSTVIGVSENASRGGLTEEPNPQYYVPHTNPGIESFGDALFIRVDDDGAATINAIRSALLALSSRLRFVEIQPISAFSAYELRAWRLGATMFTVFGILALVVAAIGLHSVLAFDVAQRTREIGLRSALGADVQRIVAIVVGSAMRMTTIGLAIGVLTALALAPRIADLLYEVQPRDPLTFIAVTAVLLVVALVASGLPALRAARVDPNSALRGD